MVAVARCDVDQLGEALAKEFAAVRAEGRAEIDVCMNDPRWGYHWHVESTLVGFRVWDRRKIDRVSTGPTALAACFAALETVVKEKA